MELGWACSLSVWLLFLGSLAVRLLRSDLLLSRLLLLRVGLLAVLQALGQAVLPLPLSAALTGAACLLVSASTARRKRIPAGGKAVVVTGESGGREPSPRAKSRRAAPPSRGDSRPALSGAGVAPAEPVARSRAGESSAARGGFVCSRAAARPGRGPGERRAPGPLRPPRSGPAASGPSLVSALSGTRCWQRQGALVAQKRALTSRGPERSSWGGRQNARRGLARTRPSAPAPSRPSRASSWRTAATRPEVSVPPTARPRAEGLAGGGRGGLAPSGRFRRRRQPDPTRLLRGKRPGGKNAGPRAGSGAQP